MAKKGTSASRLQKTVEKEPFLTTISTPVMPLTGKYIIGTGWWCDGTGQHTGSKLESNKSSDDTRRKEFFQIWYHFVNKYTNPEKIVVIDSNSPVRPDFPDDDRIEFLSLRKNFGHPIDSHRNKEMSGGSRAFLGGLFYAYLNDVDHFIYIEQDCIVTGKGWLGRCMDNMKKGKIMLGSGKDTPQPVQVSLIIVNRIFFATAIARLMEQWNKSYVLLEEGDAVRFHSFERRMARAFEKDVDLLPFGCGRVRPDNFGNEHFYAQLLTDVELKKILKKEGIDELLK